jgi:hypothetical protein
MAKALKYFYEFSDIDADDYKVEIWVEGFAGSATELIAGGNPLTRTYNKDVGEKYLGGIVPFVVNIEAISSSSFHAVDFTGENYGDAVVVVYKNATLQYNAIIVPFEGSDADLNDGIYSVNLSAECGLVNLKTINYVPSNTRKKLLNIIIECINNIPYVNTFGYTIIDNIDLKDADLNSPFYYESFIEDNFFEGLSCYDVINSIIQQYGQFSFTDARWDIKNIAEISKQDSVKKQYSYLGILQATSTYTRPTESVTRLASGSFGLMFSSKSVTIEKSKSIARSLNPNSGFNNSTGWTFEGIAPLIFEITNGYLTNKGNTWFTQDSNLPDSSYVQSPSTVYYPFKSVFDLSPKQELKVKFKSTKGLYLKNLRLQILSVQGTGSGTNTYYLTNEGTWYRAVAGINTPIYAASFEDNVEQTIPIPQVPYLEAVTPFLNSNIIPDFGEFIPFPYNQPSTDVPYQLYVRVFMPERQFEDFTPIGGSPAIINLTAQIDYIDITAEDVNTDFIDGFTKKFGVVTQKDRNGDFTIKLGVGYPSYPVAYDSLFFDATTTKPIITYNDLPIEEFIAESYLSVLSQRQKFYQGTVKANIEFGDLLDIDGEKHRIHNYEYNYKSKQASIKTIGLGVNADTIEELPVYDIDLNLDIDSILSQVNIDMNRRYGDNLNLKFVDKNIEIKTLADGQKTLSLRSDFRINTLFSNDLFLRTVSEGSIQDVAEDTEGNFTIIKPAKDGTYALLEDIEDLAWLQAGNTATVATKKLGTLDNFDFNIIRNNINIGQIKSTGLDLLDNRLNVGAVQFNLTTAQTVGIGKTIWNDTFGTLEFGLKGGNVTYRLGQSSILYVKHADNSGLTKGTVVYTAGSDGINKTVRLAQANAESTSSKTFGIIAETVSGGGKAFCITFGNLEGINTSAFAEGATIYLSPTVAGGMTTTKPSAPNHMVVVGFCLRSHATQGVIFVKVQNGFELDELHDVAISSLANNNILAYEAGTTLWKNKSFADLGLTTGTGTLNYVPKWSNATGGLTNSQIFDNGTNIGIGTVSPTYKLDIVDSTGIILRHSATANTTGAFRLIGGSYNGNGLTGIVFGANLNNNQLSYGGGTALAEPATQHIFFTGTYGTKASGNEVFRIANNGNVGINSSNPSYKLDAVGTARFTDNVIIGASPVGNNSLLISKIITGGVEASGVRSNGQLQSDVTTNGFYFRASVNQANYAISNIIVYESGAGTINGTGDSLINYRAGVNPTGFTNVYGFQSTIASGTNRYGIYNNGTAQNYFRGNVGVGVGKTVPAVELDVAGTIATTNFRMTSGAAVGRVLQSDASGNASWVTLNTSGYLGTWNANTNTPTIADGTGTAGQFYIVTVAGTWNSLTFAVGDQVYYNGTIWQRIPSSFTLPVATASVLGGVKISTGLTINAGGDLSVSYGTTSTTSATGDHTHTFGGDLSGTGGTGTIALTLATVNSNIGQFTKVTVNAKGLVTSGTNPTTLAGYGITDVYTGTESDARYVSLTGSYSNPTWITALAYSKLTGVPSTFAPSAHTLDSHSNVTITSNLAGEVLKWNGTAWINNTLAEAGIQATLSGTGLVLSTAGVITYITDNSTNWNTAFTDRNKWDGGATGLVPATGRTSLGLVIGTDVQAYDADLQAIGALSGTTGILRKTALNTWSLDTASYFVTPTALTTNFVSKWGGSSFANSQLFDNGTSVGIGTTSPSSTSKLHVNNTVGNSVRFQHTYFTNTLETNTSFARGGIFNNAEYIDEGGATKIWKIRNIGANDAAGILFGNSGTLNFISVPNVTPLADRSLTHTELLSNTRMTILPSGNVGINTTNPAYTLDVLGTIRTANILITSGATVGNFLKCTNVNGTSVWSLITTSDISNLSSWAGSTSITTLGTITSGTWNGTTIGTTRGGTGLTALGTANQILRVNAGATALEYIDFYSQVVSGFVTGANSSVLNTDTLEVALEKLQGQINVRITLTSLSSTATGLTYNNTTGVFSMTSGYTIPTTLSVNQIAYADSVGRLIGSNILTLGESRYINLNSGTGNAVFGVTSTGNNAFIQAPNGDLRLEAGISTTYSNTVISISNHEFLKGIRASGSYGTAGQVLSSTGTGVQWITGTATLTTNQIGIGSLSNTLIGTSRLMWDEYRIKISGGTGILNIGKGGLVSDLEYWIDAPSTNLNLYGTTVVSKNNHNFEFKIGLNGNYGTAGQVLTSQGSGANPTWTTVSGGTQTLDAVLGIGNIAVNKNLILNATNGLYDSAALKFQKNGTLKASIFYDNEYISRFLIDSTDKIQINANSANVELYGSATIIGSLSGSGLQMVTVDNNGILGKQAIPSGGGVGTIDQVLTAGNTSYERTFNLQNSTLNPYIHFKNNSGVLKGVIIHNDNVLSFSASTGNKLRLFGSDLELIGTNINIGYPNIAELINIQGTPFKFSYLDFFGGTYSPSNGDKILLTYNASKGAFVLQKINTYTSGGITYLTV